MTSAELDTLTLKGMLTTKQPTQTQNQTKMPNTITLRKRTKDADKKHSVIFSTESSPQSEQDIVDAIYFKRPFANGVNKITLIVTRVIDAKLDSM